MSKKSSKSNTSGAKGRQSTARAKAKKSRNVRYVLLIGDSKVGKTAFLNRILFDVFIEDYKATTEDYHEKRYVHNEYIFHLEFIDTGGPFEFPAMRDLNILRAHVSLVMYDVTNSKSIETVASILSVIENLRGKDNPLHCLIVGNKLDLYKAEDISDIYTTLDTYINFYSGWLTKHHFCSSKNNVDVKEVMEVLLDHLLMKSPKESLKEVASNDSRVSKYIFCCGFKCCKKSN